MWQSLSQLRWKSAGKLGGKFLGQLPGLDRRYLRRDIAAVDPGLRERAADEPQPRLWRAGPHVAQFRTHLVKAPDPADALGDRFAEQLLQQMVGTLVAGGEHEEFAVEARTVLE